MSTVAAVPLTRAPETQRPQRAGSTHGNPAQLFRGGRAPLATLDSAMSTGPTPLLLNREVLASARQDVYEMLEETYVRSKAPDWDGEGAPVPLEVVLYALQFLDSIPARVPNPEIYAEPDGEICFEWATGRRAVFSISVGRDGTLSYAGLFGHETIHGTELLRSSMPAAIISSIDRALGTPAA